LGIRAVSENPRPDPRFLAALAATIGDHDRFGHIRRGWVESGELRAVGVARADTLRLLNVLLEEFGGDLEADSASRATAVLAMIEIALATGVHLERGRWRDYEAAFGEGDG
jgi:hypothetical protein